MMIGSMSAKQRLTGGRKREGKPKLLLDKDEREIGKDGR